MGAFTLKYIYAALNSLVQFSSALCLTTYTKWLWLSEAENSDHLGFVPSFILAGQVTYSTSVSHSVK